MTLSGPTDIGGAPRNVPVPVARASLGRESSRGGSKKIEEERGDARVRPTRGTATEGRGAGSNASGAFGPGDRRRFPDARVVLTRRTPRDALPSLCSMFRVFADVADDAPLDCAALGAEPAAASDDARASDVASLRRPERRPGGDVARARARAVSVSARPTSEAGSSPPS